MEVREFEEAVHILNRLTEIIARPFAVIIGVGVSGSTVEFVDEEGDPIADDGETLFATTSEEIQAGEHLRMFAQRALRAATVASYQKLERLRTMKEKPKKAAE